MLRRPQGWTLVATTVIVLIAAVGVSDSWLPTTLVHGQGGRAKSAAIDQTTLTPSATAPQAAPAVTSTATPVPSPAAPVASATPEASPTAQPTAPATPTMTRRLQQGMVTEPNGMSLGCAPGLMTQYLTCTAREPEGFSMTFYLYLPRGYHEGTRYPLVLLLQGSGQRAISHNPAWLNRIGAIADPSAEVLGPGYPKPYSEDVQGHWPSFVVVPQPVDSARFVDIPANQPSYTLAPQPNDVMRMTKEIVDTLQLAYDNIDANRLYVTGFSMGAYGTWEAAERWPTYWAAAAPIAGAGDPSLAARLVDLPIWAFHSADDPVVPVAGSRNMIEAIRAAGGHPRYTEYRDLGHGSWLAPYTIMRKPSPTPDFFSWLFAQHK